MTRDFLAAMMLSVGFHVAVLFGDRERPARPEAPAPESDKSYLEFDLRPPLPDEPEIVEPAASEERPLDLAPPMQADLPQPALPDSFVQKVQPPPPEGVVISPAMTAVPAVRTTSAFPGGRIFDVAMLDQVPVPRFQARPQYPFEMRRQGIAGEVVVDFIVDTRGEVQQAQALRSSHREFEAAAVLAVSRWKFRPGRKGGQAVPTHMQVPIVFTLNDE